MSNEGFLKDWIEGKLSQEEINKLESEVGIPTKEYERILDKSKDLSVPFKTKKEDAWAAFEETIDNRESESVRQEAKTISLSRWMPYLAAAVVALLVSFYFLFPSSTVIQTKNQQQLSYKLPDGSEVLLNAGSKLSFNESEWSKNRTISLEGEAFFDVKKGTKFSVITPSGSVKVLGTSFNVLSRDNHLVVNCHSGKVAVGKDNESYETTLNPGEQITYVKGLKGELTKVDPDKTDWRSGDFYFEKVPLKIVLGELQRQFDIKVKHNESESREYTGYFSNKNLEEALQLVLAPMSLSFEKRGKEVIIK